jgi:hypothetical protein
MCDRGTLAQHACGAGGSRLRASVSEESARIGGEMSGVTSGVGVNPALALPRPVFAATLAPQRLQSRSPTATLSVGPEMG